MSAEHDRHQANTFPIYSAAVAAHVAMCGYEVRLAPSRSRPDEFVWLAPGAAADEARRMIATTRALNHERAVAGAHPTHTSTTENSDHGQPQQ